ncbi:MAG TPA: hypothetical protein V6C81_00255 [Planktothrix sp.]|jgi:hypothetical protein
MANNKIVAVVITLATAGLIGLPANAQYSLREQPVVGSLHEMEASLTAQLNNDYNAGLIDPFQLSKMTRDLDAIRCREEAFRMRTKGMTPTDEMRIAGKLNMFQANLNEACGTNAYSTHVQVAQH